MFEQVVSNFDNKFTKCDHRVVMYSAPGYTGVGIDRYNCM